MRGNQSRIYGLAAVLGALIASWGCHARNATAATEDIRRPENASALGQPQSVTFKTLDGWQIVGNLFPAKAKAQGAVVLLHLRGGSANDWNSLCLALQKAGITALAIDQRGAGHSTRGPGPVGENAPWNTSGDIAAALVYLRSKGVSGPFGLAGASYGANNALIYANAHPQAVRAVALFSPGANYHGLNALAPARKYRGAVTIYHAKNDSVAGNGPQQINALLRGQPHALHLLDGDAHGTYLLNPNVNAETASFFKQAFSGGRPTR